ncbi:MAG TPA: type II toxin-antitoxin system RelE/ParE family toxin [Rhizomicrobium sp.]|jgi:plasmid stabilization system protein ParE
MTRKIRLRRQARTEIDEAAKWYDEQRDGLGAEFVEAYKNLTEKMRERPESYPAALGNLRKASFGRFPYILFYKIYARDVLIVACVHERRDPRHWQSRV